MWIWQQVEWPKFTYIEAQLLPLVRYTQFLQGTLYGSSQTVEASQSTLDTVLANILYSSDIEGVRLDARSVRSSLAIHLGVNDEAPYRIDKKTEGLVETALDAINNFETPLTSERLFHWHSLLFPGEASLFNNVIGGQFRTGPVHVVSGRIDKPVIHFEGPDAAAVDAEMATFIRWFNESREDPMMDPIVRAGIAHLWFLTIHPFEDGNGRIGRLLMDLALAQAERNTIRLYTLSRTINLHRKEYYTMIERTQRGDMDITAWLTWFIAMLQESIKETLAQIELTVFKTKYWRRFDQSALNAEQVKVLNRMLDGDFDNGINNSQYKAVAGVSRATATRHLSLLTDLGFLQASEAGGRSIRYQLPVIQ